jgi:hypothetical protein
MTMIAKIIANDINEVVYQQSPGDCRDRCQPVVDIQLYSAAAAGRRQVQSPGRSDPCRIRAGGAVG